MNDTWLKNFHFSPSCSFKMELELSDSLSAEICKSNSLSKIRKIVEEDGQGKSTIQKTSWSIGKFNRWRLANGIEQTLNVMSDEEICDTLPQFIIDVRKDDGSKFPPNSLYDLVIGINKEYNSTHQKNCKFLADFNFKKIALVLDSEMKELTRMGYGVTKKVASEVSFDVEVMLWDKGILGCSNPR